MGNGNIVMLAFSSLAGKVGGKGSVPAADIFGGIEQCVSEIAGTAFLHVSISVVQFAGLVCGWG